MTAPAGERRTYSLGPVLPHVKKAAEDVGNRFNVASVLGWRASARDMTGHPAGRALDFMCDRAQGDQIAAYLLANADALGVEYVIWRQRIADPDEGGAWEPMEDRGSPTQNHMDHVHANFTLLPGTGTTTSTDTGITKINADQVGGGLFGDWAGDALSIGVKLALTAGALGLVVAGALRSVTPRKA